MDGEVRCWNNKIKVKRKIKVKIDSGVARVRAGGPERCAS